MSVRSKPLSGHVKSLRTEGAQGLGVRGWGRRTGGEQQAVSHIGGEEGRQALKGSSVCVPALQNEWWFCSGLYQGCVNTEKSCTFVLLQGSFVSSCLFRSGGGE